MNTTCAPTQMMEAPRSAGLEFVTAAFKACRRQSRDRPGRQVSAGRQKGRAQHAVVVRLAFSEQHVHAGIAPAAAGIPTAVMVELLGQDAVAAGLVNPARRPAQHAFEIERRVFGEQDVESKLGRPAKPGLLRPLDYYRVHRRPPDHLPKPRSNFAQPMN